MDTLIRLLALEGFVRHARPAALLIAFLILALIGTACGEDPAAPAPGTDPPVVDDPPVDDPGDPFEGPAVHVALDGVDDDACGTEDAPCRTIRQGMAQAVDGMAVLVHRGEYRESWLPVKSGVRLISADGPLAASIYSGDAPAVRFEGGVQRASVEGFEIHGDLDQGPQRDGLVRVMEARDITIRDCMIYDAPNDADGIKVSGNVDGLLIEGCIVFNPARRDQSRNPCGTAAWYQENIDIFGRGLDGTPLASVRNVTLRGCWLFHTPDVGGDWLIYSKINCENVLYEGNLFGPSAGGGCGNAAVGIGTSEPGMPDASQAVVRNAVVRDNIFTGIQGDAALAVMNSSEVWIYNNTFWGNGGDQLRSAIMLRGNTAPVEGVHLYNNLLENNHPAARGDGRLVWIREGVTAPIAHDYNLLWDNVVSSDLTLAGEPHGVAASAQLVSPRVPPLTVFDADRVVEIAQGFAPAAGSPAAGAGVAVIEMSGHPNWDPAMLQRVADVLGQDRDGAWDLGAVGAR